MRRIQGQGDATEIKQRGLSFAFLIGLTVMQIFPQYRYFHFDLNAGSGFNDEAGCIGSPLTFLREAGLAEIDFFAGFCDRDHGQVKSLLARPELHNERCSIFHGDNTELLSMVPYIVRGHKEKLEYAIGSVLSDPNGADVPIDAIAELAKICPKIDVIFHWNSVITKRLRYGIKPTQVLLQDVPRLVRKQHWLIREPLGIHQFTVLIGRNFRPNDWRSMGYHHLDSERGQEIIERCSLARHDRMARRQTDLL
jgi:hypothetical protein